MSPNMEQLEAEKHDLEKRFNALEVERDQYEIAFLMLSGALLGYSVGLLVSALCHWLEG